MRADIQFDSEVSPTIIVLTKGHSTAIDSTAIDSTEPNVRKVSLAKLHTLASYAVILSMIW